MGWLKSFFAAQPEQKNYMEGWEDGYDDGWDSANDEVVWYLKDIGEPVLAERVKEFMDRGND